MIIFLWQLGQVSFIFLRVISLILFSKLLTSGGRRGLYEQLGHLSSFMLVIIVSLGSKFNMLVFRALAILFNALIEKDWKVILSMLAMKDNE